MLSTPDQLTALLQTFSDTEVLAENLDTLADQKFLEGQDEYLIREVSNHLRAMYKLLNELARAVKVSEGSKANGHDDLKKSPVETPDQQMLRMPEVERITGIKKSSIYSGMADGTFPQCLKLSRRVVVWPSSEIQEWIRQRAKGVRGPGIGPNSKK